MARLAKLCMRLIMLGTGIYVATLALVLLLAFALPRLAEDPLPTANVVVVLSGGLKPDGTVGPFTKNRLLTGIDLVKAGHAPRIHTTGGVHKFNDTPLGIVMADFAAAQGLPRDVISYEDRSHSTIQNALFSLPEIADTDHIYVVSDRFHLARSWVSFRLFYGGRITLHGTDYDQHKPEVSNRLWAYVFCKEPLAIWFNVFRMAAWVVAGWGGVDEATRLRMLE